jgi:mannose-6-phosphate isomerase-like protein (cupin superfamily)
MSAMSALPRRTAAMGGLPVADRKVQHAGGQAGAAAEGVVVGATTMCGSRWRPGHGRRPLPHRHVNCSEAFWVLDGTITFVLGGAAQRGGPDDFLLVPRGAAHTFGNDGDEPARLLVLHAPAMDAYFAELDALWSREASPAPEEERALMARYGMEPA